MAKDRITGVARPDWDGTAFFFHEAAWRFAQASDTSGLSTGASCLIVCVFDITVVLLSSLYSAP